MCVINCGSSLVSLRLILIKGPNLAGENAAAAAALNEDGDIGEELFIGRIGFSEAASESTLSLTWTSALFRRPALFGRNYSRLTFMAARASGSSSISSG